MDHSIFKKFDKVFSGHYHMKSKRDNVYYLGNPYQLYWNDYGSKRGFHVFDTDTLKTTFYRNPFTLFISCIIMGVAIPDHRELEGAFVKLIVEEKGDYAKFDYAVSQLQNMGLADLKIIEDLSLDLENGNAVVESEDTLSLLDNYIDEIDLKVNKGNIKSVMRSLYMEASEL